ncbi:MAG: RrF2 family transcriptional regulator [Terracidiphilus sp.]
MFRLTKKAGYGLMALKYIAAYAGGGSLRAREIAEAYNIPPQLLAKSLQRLAKAGIVRSQAGIKGGYSLSRPPQQISAFDIVRAIDGPLFFASCEKGCEIAARCTIKRPLAPVNESILDLLRRISVADLTGSGQKIET